MKLQTFAASILISVVAFAPWVGTLQADAAVSGFHAAYFSESAFLTLAPGETGQFSVGYSNTGTEAWIKGIVGKQASLHTASPLDNPLDQTLGWGPTWTAPNIYAYQANDLVAPGQIGFFIYNVKVPATQAVGTKTFYGRPAIDGPVGYMEDYGYYQAVTIAQAVGGIRIANVTPASGTANNKPTLTGTDAGANEVVTISDGATGPTVGAGIADGNGNWSVTLDSGLSNGAHSLFALTVTKAQSVAMPYTVAGITGPYVVSAFATGLTTLQVQFSAAMKCALSSDRTDMLSNTSYFITEEPSGATGPTVSSVSASTDCTKATLNTNTLTAGKNYSVTVYFVKDSGGTAVDSTHNQAKFGISSPSVRSVTTKQDGTATIAFSRSMDITNTTTGGQSVLNPNNYIVDNITAASTTTTTCLQNGLNGCIAVRLLFTGGTGSVLGVALTVHTISVSNVIDAVSGGQLLTPNPSTRSVPTGQ